MTRDPVCARCGYSQREHSYNGACYGLCGEFEARELDIVERLWRAQTDFWSHTRYEVLEPAAVEIQRLRAALTDLRQRSVEEGIHHFVNRIDAALEPLHIENLTLEPKP